MGGPPGKCISQCARTGEMRMPNGRSMREMYTAVRAHGETHMLLGPPTQDNAGITPRAGSTHHTRFPFPATISFQGV